MALTAIQQLKIIAGDPSPDETDLLSLVQQSATMLGVVFYLNAKDTTSDELATAYKSKAKGVIDRVFRQDVDTIAALRRLIIVIMGGNSVTFAQVQAATDSQWEGFIYDKMDEAFEFLGGITSEEKAAYEAL